MIRRLAAQGLISHERYRGARSPAQVDAPRSKTIRRHRVIEAYLTTALGYPGTACTPRRSDSSTPRRTS